MEAVDLSFSSSVFLDVTAFVRHLKENLKLHSFKNIILKSAKTKASEMIMKPFCIIKYNFYHVRH